MSDPYFDQVSLLLPMAGSNNSTTFTDYSPSPKTITRYGNTKISTAQSKWGNGSGYFDGSGDYLTLDNTTDLDFGSGDFTIEVFLFCTVSLSTGAIVQKRIGNGAVNTDWVLSIDEGTVYFTVSNGSAYTQISSGRVIETHQWIHIAASRYNGTLTLWVGGVSAGSAAVSGAISSTSMTSYIGKDPGGNTYFTGYLQDLRITKGVARYTADFTPPTAPFPTSGSSEATGTLTGTLGPATAVFAGSQVAGTLTATLSADLADFAGSHAGTITGTITGTLAMDSAALAGSHTAGTLTGTLAGIDVPPTLPTTLTGLLNLGTFTAVAGHGVAGTLTGTLAESTAAGSGFAPLTATLSAALSALTGVGDGRVLVSGTGTATLTGLRGSVAGSVAPRGAVVGTLTGLRGQAQAVHLGGTLTGRLAELSANVRVIAAAPRPAERRSPWARVDSVPPQTLLGPLDDAPGLTLPLISIGAIRRPADGSESANTTLTLDNGDGAVARTWAMPPLLAPITVYAPTGVVWFSGVITGLTVAETVTLTVEG